MDIYTVFENLNANKKDNNTAIIKQEDQELEITITTSNNLCTISVSTLCKESEAKHNIINSMNRYEKTVKYSLENDLLVLKTTLWVDRKPTKTSLTELINIMIAKTMSTKEVLGAIE